VTQFWIVGLTGGQADILRHW